jgi:thymidylate synthase (FAD)
MQIMKVTLLDHTADPVNKIGEMASICYDSNTDRTSNIKRATHCKSKGHLMTMRFAYATFNVSGISRVCSHQLVRMAHAGILQESQRYVDQTDYTVVHPHSVLVADEDTRRAWAAALGAASHAYQTALKNGIKKEDARYILPQACTTQLNLCLNFQAWRDMLNNRTKPAAQWEVRNVALEIQRQLQEIAPEIFG